MGQTIAEKVLSRQNLAGEPVTAGDLIDARLDGLVYRTDGFRALPLLEAYKSIGFPDGPPIVFDRERVFFMNSDLQPTRTIEGSQANRDSQQIAKRLNLAHFHQSEMGISSQMALDYGHIHPGDLVVGNDSHSNIYGAINAASTGIGAVEAAFVWAMGTLFFSVPESIKVTLNGKARPYPFGKDVMLYLAGQYSDSFAQGKSVEYVGSMVEAMDLAFRFTIADHSTEIGAKFGIFLADKKTDEFMRARSDQPYETVSPDTDASYVREVTIECDELDFQVAKPYRFDNVGPVSDVVGTRIDQARIGSCANGRFEDIAIAAKMLEGRKVAPGVRFYISPASMTVYKQCVNEGLVGVLLEAGVQIQEPGCAICQKIILLNEEVAISSTTRNYHGRFGGSSCADAQIYLGGPATVTAAAIAGEIVNPKEFLDV